MLDPIRLPLDQNALIEASAGTGKTYTITTLYLRALLGLITHHNLANEIDTTRTGDLLMPMSVEQILVVTFTEAATQEIRDRVRAKLKQTQDQIIGNCDKPDAGIEVLLKEYSRRYCVMFNTATDDEQTLQDKANLHAFHVLQNAITLIDEASIFTIHGFCHRCLKQFAFETNASFEQTFEMDAKPTLYNALLDFWRKHVVELKQSEFEWFAKYWRSPKSLYQDLNNVVGKQVNFEPNVDEPEYQNLLSTYQTLVGELKQQWQAAKFSEILKGSKLKKNKSVYLRIPQLQQFIESDNWLPGFDNKTAWSMWGTDALSDANNYAKNAEFIQHSITATIDKLADVEQQITEGRFKSFWLQRAKQFIEQRAKQFKTEQQIINPDDLLTELAMALTSNGHSTQESAIEDNEQDSSINTALKSAILAKYPLAFIDEFQDTDPIQYQIFSTIYQSEQTVLEPAQERINPNRKGNMILIGDPKQAIYKFRGADIFTYLLAKQEIPETQHYTLAKNWRSHPDLVNSVNYLFSQNQQGFRHVNIPFIEVGAAKSRNEYLQIEGAEQANLKLWHLTNSEQNKGFKKEPGEALFAQWTAKNIAELLYKASEGKALFVNQNCVNKDVVQQDASYVEKSQVKASDICVLVRNRQQANRMKSALAKLNVSSVFISRDNVFDSDLAKDLLRLLHAFETPSNEQKLRAACAGMLFNYNAEQLLQLVNSPIQWQRHIQTFSQASEYWHRGQVAKALNCILLFAQTFNTWQQKITLDAERLITDFRHLTELVQEESVKLSGSQKLLLWFEQQVNAKGEWESTSEQQQLRLESDNQLVQICTLHASKGLEYPIVYLPFVCDFKVEKTALYHSKKSKMNGQEQGLTYRVDNRQLEQQIAEQERLAEDIRLLYVAMTRPVHQLVLGLFNLKDQFNRSGLALSAAGQLLLGNELEHSDLIDDELISNVCQQFSFDINKLSGNQTVCYDNKLEEQVISEYQAARELNYQFEQDSPKLSFSGFEGEINNDWRMLSYSSLATKHNLTQHQAIMQGAQNSDGPENTEMNDSELIWQAGATDEISPYTINLSNNHETVMSTSEVFNSFHFPKGANAGSCLHWIMENLDFTQPVALQTEIIEQGLERYGIENIWITAVTEWLQSVIQYPLSDFSLFDIEPKQMLVEMEFYFSFKQLNMNVLSNALLMLGVADSQPNKGFESNEKDMVGILKGFVDLTFSHQGKYYVLDYKSNYLGDESTDYQQDKLQICMSDHNYYLQALIYVFALHLFLKQRFADYDYKTHVGGAYYLFMRGMVENSQNGHNPEDRTGVYYMPISYDVIQYLETELGHSNQQDNVLQQQATSSSSTQVKKESSEAQQLGFGFD